MMIKKKRKPVLVTNALIYEKNVMFVELNGNNDLFGDIA